jgi:hypothetical protein
LIGGEMQNTEDFAGNMFFSRLSRMRITYDSANGTTNEDFCGDIEAAKAHAKEQARYHMIPCRIIIWLEDTYLRANTLADEFQEYWCGDSIQSGYY